MGPIDSQNGTIRVPRPSLAAPCRQPRKPCHAMPCSSNKHMSLAPALVGTKSNASQSPFSSSAVRQGSETAIEKARKERKISPNGQNDVVRASTHAAFTPFFTGYRRERRGCPVSGPTFPVNTPVRLASIIVRGACLSLHSRVSRSMLQPCQPRALPRNTKDQGPGRGGMRQLEGGP